MNFRLFIFLIMFFLLVVQVSCKKNESETADIEEHEHKHTEHEPIHTEHKTKHTEHEPKHTEHEHEHDEHEEILEVEITKERLELIGLKTEKLEHKVVSQHINATAEIQFNANKLFRVSPRIRGRVVEIFVDFGDAPRPRTPVAPRAPIPVRRGRRSTRAVRAGGPTLGTLGSPAHRVVSGRAYDIPRSPECPPARRGRSACRCASAVGA